MKTITNASLDDLLKSEPQLTAIVGLVESNHTLRENLHQIWDFSGDLDYLNKAAATAAEFAEDSQGLDVSIGALRDMVLWELDEGRKYHDWVCDVADTFVLKKDKPAIVSALASYIRENDCRRMDRLYRDKRTTVIQKIREGTLDVAELSLRQAPEAAAGFLKNMIRWFDWATSSPEILTDFTSMAENYAPIKRAVQAFANYEYKPHTTEMWGAQYQRFIPYLADDKTVECLRHFAGNRAAMSGFIKGIDIASITPEYVPKYLAIAESCKDIPFILKEVTDKLLKHRHPGEEFFDWDKMPEVLARESVRKAVFSLQHQKGLRKSMVSYVMEASIKGADEDIDVVANAYGGDDVGLAYAKLGAKLKPQFTDTLGIIALTTKSSEAASNFTSYVKDYLGKPHDLNTFMQTVETVAINSKNAKTVCETMEVDRKYGLNQGLSNLVQSYIRDFAQNRFRGRIAVLVGAYNDADVMASLEIHYNQDSQAQERNAKDKGDSAKCLSSSVASLASEACFDDKNLTPRLATVSALLAGNWENLKSFYWAFNLMGNTKNAEVLSTYLDFVEKHHESPSLRRAMDYFKHGYFEREKQLKPSDIVTMINSYPMP